MPGETKNTHHCRLAAASTCAVRRLRHGDVCPVRRNGRRNAGNRASGGTGLIFLAIRLCSALYSLLDVIIVLKITCCARILSGIHRPLLKFLLHLELRTACTSISTTPTSTHYTRHYVNFTTCNSLPYHTLHYFNFNTLSAARGQCDPVRRRP